MHYDTKLMAPLSSGRIAKLALMLAALGLLASCGDKKASEEKVGQSIVSVNGDEITIHQLNAELQRANVQPAQQEMAGKQITKALVDRQILVQEAIKEKLDRNPKVMQAIESAKTQILAQAYLEGKVASIASPTEAEVTEYRVQHPEIFANRKIYVMDELSFIAESSSRQDLEALSNSAKTLEDVTSWLAAHQIKYGRTQAAHAAESLPAELLNKLSKMVVGDLIFVNSNGRTLAGRMVEIKNVPISEADAKPLIGRILAGQKRKQVAEAEMARLRGLAKIEYINKKFDSSSDAAPTTVQPSAPVASPVAKPSESAAPAAGAKTENNQDKSLEKGLSGL